MVRKVAKKNQGNMDLVADLEEVGRRILKGGDEEPKLTNIARHFFDLAGGERVVAKMLLEEYRSVSCSPMVRSRILDMILRTVRWSNDRMSGETDMSGLTEEEIDAEIKLKLSEMAKGGKHG